MKRYKNKVGKYIGGFVYFHKQYIDDIDPIIHMAVADYLISHKGQEMIFNIVKYNPKTGEMSFINSPDFDTAMEPFVQEIYRYDHVNDEWNYHNYGINNNNPIYHHKWLFVKDDYEGFNVEEAKQRSAYIEHELCYRRLNKARIGYQNYWKSLNI